MAIRFAFGSAGFWSVLLAVLFEEGIEVGKDYGARTVRRFRRDSRRRSSLERSARISRSSERLMRMSRAFLAICCACVSRCNKLHLQFGGHTG